MKPRRYRWQIPPVFSAPAERSALRGYGGDGFRPGRVDRDQLVKAAGLEHGAHIAGQGAQGPP